MSYFNKRNFKLLKSIADNINFDKKLSIFILCEMYIKVNVRAQPHDGYYTLNRFLFNLVHNNVESFFVTSFENYNYYVVFKNDYIKFSKVYLIIQKLKVVIKFKEFKTVNETLIR